MGQVIESVKTVNSLLRTLLMSVLVGVAGVVSYFAYEYIYQREIQARKQEQLLLEAEQELTEAHRSLAAKEQEVAELQTKVQKLDTSIRLLKVDHRVARLDVVDQHRDPDSKELVTTIEFAEIKDDGQPLDTPRRIQLQGDLVYLDYWVVKFEDEYIQHAELDRDTSLILFRRIFGEHQQPKDGFVIDKTDGPPRAYTRGGAVSDFERQIWGDFWSIANDERKAQEMGIRAAHGQAVSIKVQPGKSYRIQLRASDGLSILPENAPPPPKRTRPAA